MLPCASKPAVGDESTGAKVGIIGAGVAGLQMARALQERGLSCVVFDKAPKPGGLWRENYEGYGVQVPHQLFEFLDYDYVKGQGACGDLCNQNYPAGADVQAYIERYVEDFGLGQYLRLNTSVVKLSRRADGKPGWTFELSTGHGEITTATFDYAVVATGIYSNPSVPSFPGVDAFKKAGGVVMHTSKFVDAGITAGKNVVVIGSGKSAIDVSMKVAEVAGKSTMVHRVAHWGTPRLIAWFIPFQYIFLSRLGQLLVSLYKGAYPEGGPAWVACLHRMLSCVMYFVFRIVEELFALQFGHYGDWRPDKDVVQDFYDVAWVAGPEFGRMRAKGAVKTVRGEVARLEAGGAVIAHKPRPKGCCPTRAGAYKELVEEHRVECDMVLCATGFKKTYDYLPSADLKALGVEDDGLYLYRQIFPPNVPELAFCGAEVACISNIATYGIHSEYIARVIDGNLVLPSPEAMVRIVEETKAWKRSWMAPRANRSNMVLLHQIHYHDQLMRDMGLPAGRKGCNFLAEGFMPYQPRDYRGVIGSGMKDTPPRKVVVDDAKNGASSA